MIKKITFKLNEEKKLDIELNKINFLYSVNSNQAGKTSTLEVISFLMLFNPERLNGQLLYSGDVNLSNVIPSITLEGGTILTNQRKNVNSNGKRMNDNFTTIKKYGNVDQEYSESSLRKFNYLNFPYGYVATKISRSGNYIRELNKESYSFGLYYQLFFIDEKIG